MNIELLFDDGSDGWLEVEAPDSYTAEQYLRELIERDKAKMILEKSISLDGCPVCERVLENWAAYSFCTHCGQRLKWEE